MRKHCNLSKLQNLMGNHTGNVQKWRTSGAYSAEAKTEKFPPTCLADFCLHSLRPLALCCFSAEVVHGFIVGRAL